MGLGIIEVDLAALPECPVTIHLDLIDNHYLRTTLSDDLIAWCEAQAMTIPWCGGRYTLQTVAASTLGRIVGIVRFEFDTPDDAMLFKLRWL